MVTKQDFINSSKNLELHYMSPLDSGSETVKLSIIIIIIIITIINNNNNNIYVAPNPLI